MIGARVYFPHDGPRTLATDDLQRIRAAFAAATHSFRAIVAYHSLHREDRRTACQLQLDLVMLPLFYMKNRHWHRFVAGDMAILFFLTTGTSLAAEDNPNSIATSNRAYGPNSSATRESKPKSPKENVEIGIHSGVGFWEADVRGDSETVVGLEVGVNAFYRPIPYLGIGGFGSISLISSELGETCLYNNRSCRPRIFRFGATLRVDPLPTSVVGPWAAVGFGLLTTIEDHFAANIDGSIGLDIRVPHVSFGPYVSGSVVSGYSANGGLRVAARF